MRQFDVRLWAIFTVPATSKKITHFRSGQKWPKNKNLAYFTKVKSKSPIHTVVVTGLRLGNRVLTNTKVKKSLFYCSISYCKQDSKEFFVFRWVPFVPIQFKDTEIHLKTFLCLICSTFGSSPWREVLRYLRSNISELQN